MRITGAASFALSFAALLALAPPAHAEDTVARPPSRTRETAMHLRAEAGTDFPLDVGARIAFEGPYRLRLSTTLGYLPPAYVRGLNGVLVDLHAYDAQTGDLIDNGLGSSLVFRAHAGWRPFAGYGFYFEGGYSHVNLGGGASAAGVLATATKQPLPPGIPGDESFSIHSVLHMVDAELGWEFLVRERVSLRTALGGAFTVASSTSVEPDFAFPAPAMLQPYETRAAGELNHIYRSYVFTPVVSASVGWAFF